MARVRTGGGVTIMVVLGGDNVLVRETARGDPCADRLGALDGQVTVTSAARSGTTVAGRLPLVLETEMSS